MILPDVNVLVHAYNEDFESHHRAKVWWEEAMNGTVGVGLPWVTILGFIRVVTNPRILRAPLPADAAAGLIDEWLSFSHVHIVQPAEGHFGRLHDHLVRLGTAGNLTTDAHLATLAMERGYVLYSADTDFHRFPGLRWRNPLTT